MLGASCQLLVVVFFWSGCCVGAVKVAHQMVVVVFSTGVEWGGGGCMMWHPGVWLSSLGGCHGVRAARVACGGGGYMMWFVGDKAAGCAHCHCC